jgi:hypothetical protein
LAGGTHWLPGDGFVVHHDLHEAGTVQRELEGLAHARVAAQRVLLGLVALADVDGDALVADLGDAREVLSFLSALIFSMSLGATRSMKSSWPERRLARRTVASGSACR